MGALMNLSARRFFLSAGSAASPPLGGAGASCRLCSGDGSSAPASGALRLSRDAEGARSAEVMRRRSSSSPARHAAWSDNREESKERIIYLVTKSTTTHRNRSVGGVRHRAGGGLVLLVRGAAAVLIHALLGREVGRAEFCREEGARSRLAPLSAVATMMQRNAPGSPRRSPAWPGCPPTARRVLLTARTEAWMRVERAALWSLETRTLELAATAWAAGELGVISTRRGGETLGRSMSFM